MSRRYPTAELYEERQRDFYRNGGRSDRSYDELDIELRRGGDPRRSVPDFLHQDYDRRSNAGQMVVRERREEDFDTRSRRGREVEEDTVMVRSGRPGPPSSVRGTERDDISIRHSEAPSRRPREVEREETDITIRHRDQSRPRAPPPPPPPPPREVEREDIVFRRGGGDRPRPREVDIEREEVRFRERSPVRRRDVEREDFVFKHEHREDSRTGRDEHKDTLVIRNRERSLPPPRVRGEMVAREREEFVVRRREPSPPPREREVIKDEIIIRRREERSPTPPPPPPPPQPEPEIRPPIIQEIITHHRHIDHGVERARSPTPPPPPPSPPRDESLEISIKRNHRGRGRDFEEDIIYERETIERPGRETDISLRETRSLSRPRRARTAPIDSDFDQEAEYYNRKALERTYPGEAYNGATKDWAIVDVPPGTNRVRMDGIGGGAQEITWQRYNGVRRSKFISGDEEIGTDFGAPAPAKGKPKDMWTEITKDLVLKEAIDSMGYSYDETDDFFYVMEYLRYEDVLQLVEISDDIRRRRKSRIRQIEYEREEIRGGRPRDWDDNYSEHEFVLDRHRTRYR
ncbi:uncharacterized protein N0V89_004826 [Didymosphaeria variabile]|uniref:DUF8035 domain-containing protein n=1 Tax=Didymosphaeria variabile TaxID=1932322 RepID=A0A9W8XQ50_9PLEO|nr:uncharacterized protein N0V89_004826 [Didymosphaeria variabile]KAJ4356790.1 hypothetical protein N0V89_004826 [Didymosphaeria variabile]